MFRRLHAARMSVCALAHGRSQRGRANLAEPKMQLAWQELREAYLDSTKRSQRSLSRLQLLEADFQTRQKRDLAKVQKAQVAPADRAQKQVEVLLSRWSFQADRKRPKVSHCQTRLD